MDQGKVGRYIASMRKQKGMTQEQLGERLGVTGKTISRWETGKYMPDIDKLQELSAFFNVSLDALLAGEQITDGTRKQPISPSSEDSAFALQDRIHYFKEKWLKEHAVLIGFWILMLLGLSVAGICLKRPVFAALIPVAGLVIYGYLRNQMMIYVEDRAYRS